MSANKFHGEYHERRKQHHGEYGLQPMNQLIADEADRPLDAQHDQYRNPEGDAEQHSERFAPEQTDQCVPRHRREPLQYRRNRYQATERHTRTGQLRGTGARTQRRQVADHQRSEHRTDDHGQHREPET